MSSIGGIQAAVWFRWVGPVVVPHGGGDVWGGTPDPRAVAVVQHQPLSAGPEPGSADNVPANRIRSYEQTLK